MKKIVMVTLAVMVVVVFASSLFAADPMVLWGEQTAGSGHMKNAKTDGNTLVLTAPATIAKIEGDAPSYCIWTIVTPQNRNARSILCGGEGRPNIVGRTIPAGSYRLIPGVEGRSFSRITITFK
ncbi:MAG: hypothetical protein P9M03_09905 [Candidatus Theseobacter exili]|nr:hypothetical protein [Candidatus Theseobacter exili]